MTRVVEVAGQSYEFPDDAPDEAVMAFVNKHAPKPATMMDVVKAIPSNVMNNLVKGTEGTFSMMGDVGLAAGMPAQVLLSQAGKRLIKPGRDAAEAAVKADTPQNMSTAQEIALAGGSSVLAAIPDLLLGGGVAKAAQAAGFCGIFNKIQPISVGVCWWQSGRVPGLAAPGLRAWVTNAH